MGSFMGLCVKPASDIITAPLGGGIHATAPAAESSVTSGFAPCITSHQRTQLGRGAPAVVPPQATSSHQGPHGTSGGAVPRRAHMSPELTAALQ